jgi:hypothetical protein
MRTSLRVIRTRASVRIAAFLLVLIPAVAACTADRGPFTINGGDPLGPGTPETPTGDAPFGVPGNTTGPATYNGNQPAPRRTRNLDLALARERLSQLRGADDAARKDIFTTVLEMGEQALVEVDRALAYCDDDGVRLDLSRLRQLMLDDMDAAEAARTGKPAPSAPTDPNTPKIDKIYDPNAPKPGDANLPAGSGIPNDYNLPAYGATEDDFNPAEVDRFVLSRFKSAHRALQLGDTKRAVEMCEALLLLAPGTRYRREVQELLRDARAGVQSTRYLAGTLRFEKRSARFKDAAEAKAAGTTGALEEPLTFSLFLKNLSAKDIDLDLGDGLAPGHQSLLALEIEVREEDASGQSISTRGPVSIRLTGEKIRLTPDQSYVITDKIESLGSLANGGGSRQILSVLNVEAELRPASLTVDIEPPRDGKPGSPGTRQFRPVVISGAVAYVLPAGFELATASGKPASFIADKLSKKQYEQAYMAWPLVGPAQLCAVLDTVLSDTLNGAPVMELNTRTAMAAKLTNESFGANAARWLAWWRENRYRYESGKQPTGASAAPAGNLAANGSTG